MTAEESIRQTIGALIIENATLREQVEKLSQQVQSLTDQSVDEGG